MPISPTSLLKRFFRMFKLTIQTSTKTPDNSTELEYVDRAISRAPCQGDSQDDRKSRHKYFPTTSAGLPLFLSLALLFDSLLSSSIRTTQSTNHIVVCIKDRGEAFANEYDIAPAKVPREKCPRQALFELARGGDTCISIYRFLLTIRYR